MKQPKIAMISFALAGTMCCAHSMAQDEDFGGAASFPDPADAIQRMDQSIADDIKQTDSAISAPAQREMDNLSSGASNVQVQQSGNAGVMTGTITPQSTSSHSESTSHGSGSSVSVGVGPAVIVGPATVPQARTGDAGVAPPNPDLPGTWILGLNAGGSCTITLQTTAWYGGWQAYLPTGCPEGFADVDRWVQSGNQLLLTTRSDLIQGQFWQAGPGLWTGRRESDGAPMYLKQ